MKKIISNKLYDTDTAREIGIDAYDGSPRDFAYWRETLYLKRTGEYFLHGEGGPMSRYAQTIGDNEWSGGAKIIPLTYDAARAWAEEHLNADAYQAAFGPVSESGERVTLTISIDAATAERIRREAQETGASISALIASRFPA